MTKLILTFKPKQITKALLSALSDRAQDVIKRRYGLADDMERETLESIGKSYNITRERVRQIENFALSTIRRSNIFKKQEAVFNELRDVMDDYGSLVREEDFLDHLSRDESYKNHIHFLLVVGDYFEKLRENDEFHHRWTTDTELAEKVHKGIRSLYRDLDENELVSEAEMVIKFLKHLQKDIKDVRDSALARRWLSISKYIGKNPLGEWGVAHSPNVRARGIRDLAYLILRNHGSPMHFREVAKKIEERFGRDAHHATVHNELIKDKRFVLVGRGLYALFEWGYKPGVVRDVIKNVLEHEGPLTKEQVVDKVLKERHVKENTILVNLQNSRFFKKDWEGRYSPA
jgi:hypothetical protein